MQSATSGCVRMIVLVLSYRSRLSITWFRTFLQPSQKRAVPLHRRPAELFPFPQHGQACDCAPALRDSTRQPKIRAKRDKAGSAPPPGAATDNFHAPCVVHGNMKVHVSEMHIEYPLSAARPPASRQTLIKARSKGMARSEAPHVAQAARWSPRASTCPRQLQCGAKAEFGRGH